MNCLGWIQLVTMVLALGFLGHGVSAGGAGTGERGGKSGAESRVASPFERECRRGEASPYSDFIARLGRKLRTTDCGELRRRLAQSQHLYIGGQPLAGPEHSGRLAILAEFTALTSLNINLTGSRDLCPLAALTNLRRLIARNNRIRDMGCLAGLKRLQEVNLGGNMLRRVGVLGALPELRRLLVNDNQIMALDLRRAHKALEVVQVHRNGLERLQVAPGLHIAQLGAGGNALGGAFGAFRAKSGANGAAIARLSFLKRLDLSDNGIDQVAFLSGLKHLEYVTLSYNQIRDLTPLKELRALTRLWLSDNPLGTAVAKTEANCPTSGVSEGLAAWCREPAQDDDGG